MGVRGRLLALALGVSLPLALVGLIALWGIWAANRRQLDQSVEQQAELAAVALERWLRAHREPLTLIATSATAQQIASPAFAEHLRFVSAQLRLIDLRVLDARGGTRIAQPANAEPLSRELSDELLGEIRRRRAWAISAEGSGRGGRRPVLAIGLPTVEDGAVVTRVDGVLVGELFRDIELSDGAVLSVFDPRGRILYRSAEPHNYVGSDTFGLPLLAALRERRSAVVETVSPFDGVRRVNGLARAGETNCVVLVGVPSAILRAPAGRNINRYLLFSLLGLTCGIASALIIARGIARPLRQLRDAAKRLGVGDLKARAPIAGSGEVADLGAAFNQMAERIEEREERLTELDRLKSEFIGGISHELRTPLTTIKTLTRVMLREGASEAERREYLETIAAECDREINLVVNLLNLSRLEAGTFNISLGRTDVTEIARACLLSVRQAAAARDQELELALPPEALFALADYEALRRVVCELVESAAKYTPDGGRIKLAARAEGEQVVINVSDNGPGIALEDLPHIFEKFYRGRAIAPDADEVMDETAGYPSVPGIGLGLYVSRKIVERMGGRISVESEVGRGSRFIVELPAWRDEGVTDAPVEE